MNDIHSRSRDSRTSCVSSRTFYRMSSESLPVAPANKFAMRRQKILRSLYSRFRGDNEIRTRDPLLARQVLSQLSYTPRVGLNGLEPSTSRLSGVRSNQLSYKPISLFYLVLTLDKQIWSRQPPALPHRLQCSTIGRLRLNRRVRDGYGCFP